MSDDPKRVPSEVRIRDLTIGRLAALVGVPLSTIRYYEKRKLLAPKRRGRGDYRVFDAESVRSLRLIAAAKEAGFTLRETTSLLSLRDRRDCRQVRPIVVSKLEELHRKMDELRRQESTLIALGKLCEDPGDESCHFITALSEPSSGEPQC